MKSTIVKFRQTWLIIMLYYVFLTETYSCPPLAMTSQVPNLNPTPPPTVITVGNEGNLGAGGTDGPSISGTGIILTLSPNIPVTSEVNAEAPAQNSNLIEDSTVVIMGIVIAVSVGALLILLVTSIAIVIVKRQRKRNKIKGFTVVDPGEAFSNQVYMNRHSGQFKAHKHRVA